MSTRKHLNAKTKIVATLGPNSSSVDVLEKMIEAGLSVARINMSHGDHASHQKAIRHVRMAARKAHAPVAILQDLSGPKIRIGDFTSDLVTLESGKKFILSAKPCEGTVDRVFVNYSKLPKEITKGSAIYLNDGKQELVVDEIRDHEIHTTVVHGGTIRGRRGVNVPDARLSISSLTDKDKKDLAFGLKQNVDFVTLSFVRDAQDIHTLRKLIKKLTNRPVAIIAKIETKLAIDNLSDILAATDAVMVARGDLAIEVPAEKVPLLQKQIIRLANNLGKPVITATQMLDSMKKETTPTRAEVSDIANAILDGTDAIMLSDETAIGDHPARSIQVMTRVSREVESDPFFVERTMQWNFAPNSMYEAVGRSISQTALTTGAKAIVTFSESGQTARMVARYRPLAPILVLTPNQITFNQTLISYGCLPVLIHKVKSLAGAQKCARKVLKDLKFADAGDVFVIGVGIPFGKVGATNMMLVEKV